MFRILYIMEKFKNLIINLIKSKKIDRLIFKSSLSPFVSFSLL